MWLIWRWERLWLEKEGKLLWGGKVICSPEEGASAYFRGVNLAIAANSPQHIMVASTLSDKTIKMFFST
jgi:hypothetical protein